MQPNTLRYCDDDDELVDCFGEVNEDNRLHGRGVEIFKGGRIDIGYYEDGWLSTGNYIGIASDGGFSVGEIYLKDGKRRIRGTNYFKDGSE